MTKQPTKRLGRQPMTPAEEAKAQQIAWYKLARTPKKPRKGRGKKRNFVWATGLGKPK